MRRIVIANQKGGVAKSTTAVNLAIGLAYAGKQTLLIDIDPQANATFATLGYTEPEHTILEFLLLDEPKTEDVIHSADISNLNVMPSKLDLAVAETELISPIDGRIRLRNRLNKYVNSDYDYLIIDVPPSLGMLTINALAAVTEVIIPVAPSMFGLHGIARLEDTIDQVREHLSNPELRISGILCTFYDYTNVASDVVGLVKNHFGDLIFDTIIPKNVKIEEANSRSKSIYAYAPDSKGALAYAKFVEEVISRG